MRKVRVGPNIRMTQSPEPVQLQEAVELRHVRLVDVGAVVGVAVVLVAREADLRH